ncbi:hypothetical protein GQ457_02G030880 [Hibiscus cannabinus]
MHLLPQFVGAETAASVLSMVLKFFANRSTTSVMSLHCKLRAIRKGDESMRSYLTQIKEVCDAFAACNSAIFDLEQIATILNGLPMEYHPFMAIITTIQKDNQGNQRDNQYKPQYSRFQQGRGNRGGRGRVRLQCQLCGKYGHSVDRCWHRFNQEFAGVMATSNSADAHLSESANVHSKCHVCTGGTYTQPRGTSTSAGGWVVDSGAAHHTTPDESNVVNGVDYNGPGKLVVGNGHSLQISKTGYALLPAKSRTLVINDLLVVPSITKSLISVSKFARDNAVYFEFHAQSCMVKDERTGEVLLRGQENNGLYQLFGLKSTDSGHSIEVNTASQQGSNCASKLTIVNRAHRMDTPQLARDDAGQDGVHLAYEEGLQYHGGEVPTGIHHDTRGNARLGHAREDTRVILADDELEPALGEEANQISTGAGQVTDMVPSSELETGQSNNMDSDNAMHCDMGATLSPQQDDVVITQSSSNRHHMVTRRQTKVILC